VKVAYLLGSLNRGGAETLLLDVFNQSSNSPFEIIGVYRKEGELANSFRSTKVPLFKIEPRSVWLIWHYLCRLRNLLKSEMVDIVHAQQNLDAVYARVACIGLSIKVVQTFHGYDFNSGCFSKKLIHLSLLLSELNIFVSETQRKYYASGYNFLKPSRTEVVYNGVCFEKLIVKEGKSIRIKLKMEKKGTLIGMVGNFVSVRDQMTVCRFLNLLNKKGIDFTFLFIGKQDESNPKLFDECRYFCEYNGLAEKVLFLGSCDDVPALLSELDAFVYASNHDTFGIAVIEAIAAGIPVFVNDWEVMKEITENGAKAVLYRTKDENDLFNQFLLFLNDPVSYKKKALENAAWARQSYSIQNHISNLYKVYCSLK